MLSIATSLKFCCLIKCQVLITIVTIYYFSFIHLFNFSVELKSEIMDEKKAREDLEKQVSEERRQKRKHQPLTPESQQTTFKNIVAKRDIAHDKQFLSLSECFLVYFYSAALFDIPYYMNTYRFCLCQSLSIIHLKTGNYSIT